MRRSRWLSGVAGFAQTLEVRLLPSAPSVVSINRKSPSGTTTDAGSVQFEVVFSKPVTGVDAADFVLLKDGSVATTTTQVGGSGTTYVVTVSGITGEGTIGLELLDNGTIRDADGHGLNNNPGGPAIFAAQKKVKVGQSPYAIAVGDLNGDGRLDVVTGNAAGVSVLLGDGAGGFAAAASYATGTNVQGVAIGDVDGDTIPDLVTANYGSNSISVLHGNGNGTFGAASNLAVGVNPTSIALADVNNDHHLDLITAIWGSNAVEVRLGHSTGLFDPAVIVSVGSGPRSIATSDLNHDGKLDIVVANNTSGDVSVLLGNGSGGFAATRIAGVGSGPYAVAVLDVSGDGKPDVVTSNANGNDVSVLLGNGAGGFGAVTHYGVGKTPLSVAIADMNGDDKPDIIAPSRDSSTVTVLSGNGTGSFGPGTRVATGLSPYSVQVGDFDGDGQPDLVTANRTSGDISSVLNDARGDFIGHGQFYTIDHQPAVVSINRSAPSQQTTNATTVKFAATFSEPVTGVTAADFAVAASGGIGPTRIQVTGSGANYVVTVSHISGTGTLGLNLVDDGSIRDLTGNRLNSAPGGPVLFSAPKPSPVGAIPYSVQLADFNKDGKLDAVTVLDQFPGLVSVQLGDGTGLFGAARTFAMGGNGPLSLTIGDFNRDGKVDIACVSEDLGNAANAGISVLLGDGRGSFSAFKRFPTTTHARFLTTADLNNDGKLDIITLSDQGTNVVSVLMGDGRGAFGPPTTFAVGDAPNSLAVADLNGDGKLDVVTANRDDGSVSVLLGNGAGAFATAITYSVGDGSEPVGVAVGDVNGDGRPDLVTANQTFDDNVSVLLGTGNGAFAAPILLSVDGAATSIVIADVNGDRKPDLVVGTQTFDGKVSILLGNGTGNFAVPTSFPATVVTGYLTSIMVVDVNGDGRPDIVTSNAFESCNVSVLLNLANGSFIGQTYLIVL